MDGNLVRLRDALDRCDTIQSILYPLAVALLIVLSSVGVFYALNLPSDIEFTETSMTCRFYFSEPTLSEVVVNGQVFTQVSMEHCFPQALVGQPSLPVYPATLLLPADGVVDTIEVSYTDSILLSYDFTEKPVLPQQEFVPLSVGSPPIHFVVNVTAYEADPPLCTHLCDIGERGFCRGFAILTVYLYPVQYQPTQGRLYYLPELSITVTFKEATAAQLQTDASLLRYSEHDRQLIQSIVANPTLIDTYALLENGGGAPLLLNGVCDPSDNNGSGYQYVIITSEALESGAEYPYKWSDLIVHRESVSGLEGTIVTVEAIDDCTAYWNETALFNDTPAHIRMFCTDAYLNWGTEYVLLGGDWDSTPSHQVVPYRLFTDRYETYEYSTMACDLYYSHLDGTWWDETNGVWGGGRLSGVNDYYGELSVGRLAVSSASDVSNVVQKIIWYDTYASGYWVTNGSFWGGNLGWKSTSKQYMEELRLGTDTYRTFTGFEEWNDMHQNDTVDTSSRIYHADIVGSPYTKFFTEAVEDDVPAMINHIDHSDWDTPFSLSSWSSLSNTKPFFGYSQGCLAGRYQSGDAGCEQLICEKPASFAYGLVLNTGYGYGSTTSTNGPGQYLQCYFWDYFFTNQSSNMSRWMLGKAFLYSQDLLGAIVDSQSSHGWCYNWYSSHLFGDPAQVLRVHVENQPVVLSSEDPVNGSTDVSVDVSSLSVSVADPEGDSLDWNIATSPAVGSNASTNASNGTLCCPVSGLAYDTTYTWSVSVYDGYQWTNASYAFTTEADPQNNSPCFSSCLPANGTCGVPLNRSSLWLTVEDPEGDVFNWTMETSPNVGVNASVSDHNGTKYCPLSGLQADTTYVWYVNATDAGSGNTTTAWYRFTTNQPPHLSDPSPAHEAANISIGTTLLSVSLTDPEGDPCTYTIYTSPDIGTGSGTTSSNGTISSAVAGLNYSSVYLWSVNVSDGQSWTNETFSFTTEPNDPPLLSMVSPSHGSTGVSLSTPSVSVSIQDPQGETFNWSIITSPDVGTASETNASNGTKSCVVSGLAYATTYTWSVSSQDLGSGLWTNATYWFTTEDAPAGGSGGWTPPPEPPVQENHAPAPPTQPSGPKTGEPNETMVYLSSASDPDNDSVQLQIDWGDGTLSEWSGLVASNTTVSCEHSWSTNGSYAVRVRAQDEHSMLGDWSAPLVVAIEETIRPLEPPVVEITVSENISANQTVVFDASIEIDPTFEVVSYFWDFGDGTTAFDARPEHFYSTPGAYDVTLVVTDNEGNSYQTTVVITVTAAVDTTPESSPPASVSLILLGAGIILLSLCFLWMLRRTHSPDSTRPHAKKQTDGEQTTTAVLDIGDELHQHIDLLLSRKQKK